MPSFSYTVLDKANKRQKGRLDADSLTQARAHLKDRGLTVITLNPQRGLTFGKPRRLKISLKDKLVITEQLAVMVKAGLPVSKAFAALQNQTFPRRIHEMLVDISTQVEGGTALNEAMERYHDTFGQVYLKMLAAGEKSGKLDEILAKLALQLQKDADIRSKIRAALMYPIVIVCLMFVVVVVVMVAVVPRLAKVFSDANVTLPAPTRALISLSGFVVAHGVILIIAIVILVIAIKLLLRNESISLMWDTIKVRIPIYGGFVTRVYMARFTLTVASLISSGLPILEIFGTGKEVIDNKAYRRELEEVIKKIENGSPIATALAESRYFPVMMSQLISVGEQSGSLEDIMWVIAGFYEKEVDAVSQNLSSALEPLIMIALGIGIAFILLSVMQPMYSLVGAM